MIYIISLNLYFILVFVYCLLNDLFLINFLCFWFTQIWLRILLHYLWNIRFCYSRILYIISCPNCKVNFLLIIVHSHRNLLTLDRLLIIFRVWWILNFSLLKFWNCCMLIYHLWYFVNWLLLLNYFCRRNYLFFFFFILILLKFC